MRRSVSDQAIYVRLGCRIHEMRMEAAIPQREFARRIGVNHSFLERIEDTTTACPLHVLVRIAHELDTTLDELVPVEIDSREQVA